LEQRLSKLSDEHKIVAYCRGGYCVFAFEAISISRRHGFKVRQLEDGFPEWKADGLPATKGGVETSAQA
jgi:ArsR family transcriptional regulator